MAKTQRGQRGSEPTVPTHMHATQTVLYLSFDSNVSVLQNPPNPLDKTVSLLQVCLVY